MTADKGTDDLRAALVSVVEAAWELNATMPDRGDGDPLTDLDDAIGALAERLGIVAVAPLDELRAALATVTPDADREGLDVPGHTRTTDDPLGIGPICREDNEDWPCPFVQGWRAARSSSPDSPRERA